MKELNDIQLGALCEMGNIGAGNAATAMSQLLGMTIDIKVPHVRIVPIEKAVSDDARGDVRVALYLKVEGEAPGKALFLMTTSSGEFIARRLMGSEEKVDLFQHALACSAIQEVGNILVSSFLVALTNFSGIHMQSSVPHLSIDMLGAMMDGIFLDGEGVGDTVLIIDTEFTGTSALEGIFLFIPDGDALDKLLGVFGL